MTQIEQTKIHRPQLLDIQAVVQASLLQLVAAVTVVARVLRLEIAHALKIKKNVVPVVMEKFEWPKSIEDLPEEIRELQKNNAFTYSHIHWKIIQDKLIGHLTSKQGNRKPPT